MKLILFLIPLLFTYALAYASPFSDIPSNHWAKNAVLVLAEKGFVSGFSHDVFGGNRPATRYETAVVLARVLAYLQKARPEIPPQELDKLKETLADYQDEIDSLGIELSHLETGASNLESRVDKAESIQVHGKFSNRDLITGISGNLGNGTSQSTLFADEMPDRPYALLPVHAGEGTESAAFLDVSGKLDDDWKGGGRIAAYAAAGDTLNRITPGYPPPFLNNPFEGYSVNNNLKAEVDQIFAQKDDTLRGELGSFYLQHSPSYLYAGVPNFSEEGPDFLPNLGGRLEADMKPYFFVSKAYSELFVGKIGQGSPWRTELYGGNFGIELLGVSVNAHWMSTQNDANTFAPGTAGSVTSPINGGAGWLDPNSLAPLSVGPQREKVYGIDLAVNRTYKDHPYTFQIAYASSDYKPNTNSSNNAGGELYDIALGGELTKQMNWKLDYLSIDPKYSPFILPLALPAGFSTATFPWGQWPFPVEFQGYYTLQNAQEYPQNRSGMKGELNWTIPRGKITASYRVLAQKIPTELTSFDNAADIQSIGFYEPLFTATGGRGQTLPAGRTLDYRVKLHYDLSSPLAFELAASGGRAKRYSGDANNIDFTGWLGHAGFTYQFWEKWKVVALFHLAQTDGRLLAAPIAAPNYALRNSGETVRTDYALDPKTNLFLEFRSLNHIETTSGNDFNMLQYLTGMDYTF